MLPMQLPRSSDVVLRSDQGRGRPCDAGPSHAPKGTRTSTRLSRTRPSTWRVKRPMRADRAAASTSSTNLDGIDDMDDLDVATDVATYSAGDRRRRYPASHTRFSAAPQSAEWSVVRPARRDRCARAAGAGTAGARPVSDFA